MLHVNQLYKRYGPDVILQDISFVINPGERVALVGPNGSGKTTLLRLISGLEKADRGRVRLEPDSLRLGYLSQALEFETGDSIANALQRATAPHHHAWTQMEVLQEAMAQPENIHRLAELTTDYAQAEVAFEAAGGYDLEARREIVLTGLGLADLQRDLPVSTLSGGQKTRLGLAGLLIDRPDLLLLDEPTNHLDVTALDWLAEWLHSFSGAVLIVSHDRNFLDEATNRTLILDPETRTLRDFPGNYSAYVATRTRETEQQWQAYKDQQAEIAELQQAARHLRGLAKMKRGGKADDGDKFAKGFFSNRSAASVGRAKQIERRIEQLQGEDRVQKPGRQWGMKLDLTDDQSGARQVLTLDDVGLRFGGPFLFRHLSATLNHGQRVALMGPNGEGKTSLLRLIVGQLEASEGTIRLGAGVKVGYFAQEQEVLAADSTPFDTIRTEAVDMTDQDVRNFLHFYLFGGDDVFQPIGTLSFGERARLMLARLAAQGCNFLLLDEPVNHLDLTSRERFEEALRGFPGTVLAVTHDRAFVHGIADTVWELRQGRLIQHLDLRAI